MPESTAGVLWTELCELNPDAAAFQASSAAGFPPGIDPPGWARDSYKQFCEAEEFPESPDDMTEAQKKRADDYRDYLGYIAAVKQLCEDGIANHAALCLSGGGIRSAAFSLGILEGLAHLELLDKFHYLSTVSGGGYIGAWLTAWRTREPGGLGQVQALLGADEDPAPLRHIRYNQEYLTPKAGVGSPDTWAGVAAWFRNTGLNWLVIVPVLLALTLLPRAMMSALAWGAQRRWIVPVGWVVAGLAIAVGAGLLARPMTWAFNRLNRAAQPPAGASTLSAWASKALTWASELFAQPTRSGLPVVLPATIAGVAMTAVLAWCLVSDRSRLWWLLPFGSLAFLASRAVLPLRASEPPNAGPAQAGAAPAANPKGRCRSGEFLLTVPPAILAGLALYGGGLTAEALLPAVPTDPGYATFVTAARWNIAGWLTVFGPPAFLLSIAIGDGFYALARTTYASKRRRTEWLARADGFLAATAITWIAVTWLALFAFRQLVAADTWAFNLIYGIPGLAGLILSASPWTGEKSGSKPRLLSLDTLSSLLLTILMVWVFAGISAIGAWLVARIMGGFAAFPPCMLYVAQEPVDALTRTGCHLLVTLGLAGVSAAIGAGFSFIVEINWFSLAVMYRARLVRTFLGATQYLVNRPPRRDPFTKFGSADDLALCEIAPSERLYHVLNVTANISETRNLAWQERKGEPFIFSRRYVGGDRVGYQKSECFAKQPGGGMPVTLGTAMAASGAAVSPNWGYHTSPMTSFFMALFNVRLGWWVGNPQGRRWQAEAPRSSLMVMAMELAGMTTDDKPWLYVSDGGHFDNLGIYEMLRRRCRLIVASDAGQDGSCAFYDLGSLVRKARIDFGIVIKFGPIHMSAKTDPRSPGLCYAVADIEYPEGLPGKLLYIKPGLYGGEPADIRAYAASNPAFPHDTTLNQFFSETQFESYRSLGNFIVKQLAGTQKLSTLPSLVGAAELKIKAHAAQYPRAAATTVQIMGQ